MTNIITAVIVIYNKKIDESITCKNIQSLSRDIDLLVVDNSEIDMANEEYCKATSIRYISMKGNKGLSKAYNTAIDNSPNSDVIVFFDDDTEIKQDYFNVLKDALDKYPDVDIFAPIIKGQDGVIYSPNEFNFLKNHFIVRADQKVSQEAFNAIASCLAVRVRVFETYRFNEKLFVDQVDQYFFCEQRKLGRKFGILNVEILQNFYQRGATLTPEAGWNRLRLRIYDIYRHARLMGKIKYIFLSFVKCCGLGIQIGMKSKSIEVVGKSMALSISLLIHER